MRKDGLVSILIPAYNREKYIGECIQSALDQTYMDFEIIIVDNASTDNTWSIIQEYAKNDSRVKAYRNKVNIGPVRNWVRCVDEANGEFGKILWSDDLIAPQFLEETVGYLENNNQVGFVFTGIEVFEDGAGKKIKYGFIGETGVYESERYIKGVLLEGHYPVSPGCALFRLESIKNNMLIDVPNKVNSDFSMHAIGNDLLLFLLTAHQYKSFAFINDRLSFFRAHGESISNLTNDGKLPLHYDLAKTYFVENYRNDLIKKMNVNLLIDLKRYPASKKYGLKKVSDFYLSNLEFGIDMVYFMVKGIKIILNNIKSSFSSIER